MWIAAHAQNSISTMKRTRMLVSLSLVYWFFTIFVPTPSKQQTKHVMTLSVCKNVRILNFWGYGLRSKRFEGSRLYSKIILGLQAAKRWGSGLRGKKIRAQGLWSPPLPPPPFGTLKNRQRRC